MTTEEHTFDEAEGFVSAAKYNALKQDYDKFAYIVSHDINAPLRHIREFTKILLADLEPHIEGENRQCADIILRNVDSAENLIGSLIQFSRLTTRIQPFERFSTTALVKDIVSTLEKDTEGVGGDVCVGELPTLLGDEAQICRLFQCLIDNAIKFRRPEVPLEIAISGQVFEDSTEIAIQDNGMGVPENRLEKVFDLFHRHHVPGNDGVGLGLALCRKIAWLHGGNIRMESVVDSGSKVIVCLPTGVE